MADIELVIRINEEDYQALKQGHVPFKILDVIRNGTPLPKGHGRLIDADKTILKICGSSCGCHLEECGRDEPCFSVSRIASASTIIEADKAESKDKSVSAILDDMKSGVDRMIADGLKIVEKRRKRGEDKE